MSPKILEEKLFRTVIKRWLETDEIYENQYLRCTTVECEKHVVLHSLFSLALPE